MKELKALDLKSQRSGEDGFHACNHLLSWWGCGHVSELPGGYKVGRSGWTRICDRGEFCGGVSGPQGDDEIH